MIFLPCSSRMTAHMCQSQWHQWALELRGPWLPSSAQKQNHNCKFHGDNPWHGCSSVTSTDGTFQLCWHFSSTAFLLFQSFLLLTWTGFGSTNGMRASMVTTQGEMVVPRLLLRKGPRGTYSHFWMSRAGKRTFKAMQLNIPQELHIHQTCETVTRIEIAFPSLF